MLVKFADTSVHIKDLQYGVVLQAARFVDSVKIPDDLQIGHLVGFSRDKNNDLLLVVNFNCRNFEKYPSNLFFNIE